MAPPAGTVPGMSVTKMRGLAGSNPDWKQKEKEAKKAGTKCAADNCSNTVGVGGTSALTIEHMLPAATIMHLGQNKQSVNQMRRHFTRPSNLILLCKSCNSSKGGKTFTQFAADSGRMSAGQASTLQAQATAFRQVLLKL